MANLCSSYRCVGLAGQPGKGCLQPRLQNSTRKFSGGTQTALPITGKSNSDPEAARWLLAPVQPPAQKKNGATP